MSFTKYNPLSVFFWSVVVFIAVAMIWFGLQFPQSPYSDFMTHWLQALNFADYLKGGVSMFVYRAASYFFITPDRSALIVNCLCWFIFCLACCPRLSGQGLWSRRFMSAMIIFSLLLFGYWWIAVSATVDVMPIFIALFFGGLRLMVIRDKPYLIIIGILLMGLALSIRVQAVLALGLGLAALFPFYFSRIRSWLRSDFKMPISGLPNLKLVLGVVLAMVTGVLIEFALRAQSVRQEAIIVSQRSQLYFGLLDTNLDKNWCGAWNHTGANLARLDLDKKLFEIFRERGANLSLSYFLQLSRCKLGRALLSDTYVWWIPRLNTEAEEPALISKYPFFHDLESRLNKLLRFLLLIMVAMLFTSQFRTEFGLRYLGFSYLIGFLIVYCFLEFNPRYQYQFIPMIIFLTSRLVSGREPPPPRHSSQC